MLKAKSDKLVKITQTSSPIGRKSYQRQTLIGLGLNKLHRSKVLKLSPETLGMIKKVSHLVNVEYL